MFKWMLTLMLSGYCGLSIAILLSCIFYDNYCAAVTVSINVLSLFSMGSGLFTNLAHSNAFAKGFCYISPFRYALELILRQFTSGYEH